MLACIYIGTRYLAAREGLPLPGVAGGIAMAAAYLTHIPFLDAAARKAVGVAS